MQVQRFPKRARLDVGLRQPLAKARGREAGLFAIHFDRSQPIVGQERGLAPRFRHRDSRQVGQPLRIEPVDGLTARDVAVHYSHLPSPNACRHIAKPVIIADPLMLIPGERLARLGGIELHLPCLLLRRAQQGTPTTGGDHLVAIEGEDAILAYRTAIASVVDGSHCLSRVFHHGDTVASGYLTNFIHAGGCAVEMHRNDGLGLTPRLPQAILYGRLQQVRIHVPGVRLTVHENGGSPLIANRVGGGGEGEALTDHLIARCHAQHHQGQVDSRGARRESHRVHLTVGALGEPRRQLPLKAIHVRPQGNYPVGIKSLTHEVLLGSAHVRQR